MPSRPSTADLAAFAHEASQVADAADHLLQQSWGEVSVTEKADGSLVTQTDHAVDKLISTYLADRYPDHAVLSEERTTTYDPSVEFTWVVDPLDGTTNFARGIPVWGVSIALLWSGEPVVGLLSFVSLHERYLAWMGHGSTLNARSLKTDQLRTVDNQHFLMLCTRTPQRYSVNTPLKPRILGSAAYHIAAVANGSALAGIEATPKLWDLAAALLILTEAGGCYRSLSTADRSTDTPPPLFPLPQRRHDYVQTSYPILVAANEDIMCELEPNIARR